MAKFMLPYKNADIARQLAALLNQGGQLVIAQSVRNILSNPITYMLEMDKSTVIGFIGIERKSNQISELKHLCVHPNYRRQGIGLALLKKGVEFAPTEKVYGLVRSDNKINIRNNFRAGFVPIGKYWGRNCHIIVFVARRNNDRRANNA